MMTNHPWFGPKNGFGWGWTPISWEGWAFTALWLLAFGAAYFVLGPTQYFAWAVAGLVAVLLAVCVLTGTRPG